MRAQGFADVWTTKRHTVGPGERSPGFNFPQTASGAWRLGSEAGPEEPSICSTSFALVDWIKLVRWDHICKLGSFLSVGIDGRGHVHERRVEWLGRGVVCVMVVPEP